MKRVSITRALPVLIIVTLIAAAVVVTTSHTLAPFTDKLFSDRLVYSKSAAISELWSVDKARLIETNGGRVLNPKQTTTNSDAQARMSLRAVWSDDKQTFDRLNNWTQSTILNANGLLASSYGHKPDASYGILNTHSNTGADIDYSLSLLMAYRRWGDEKYLDQAKNVIPGIYESETTTVNGTVYLLPSDSVTNASDVRINPADYKLYAFREFAKVDAAHPWNDLVISGQEVITKALNVSGGSLGIDQISISPLGVVSVRSTSGSISSNMAGYAFNLSLDYAWNHKEMTMEQLASLTAIDQQYTQNQSVAVNGSESLVGYGQLIGYFKYIRTADFSSVSMNKLYAYYGQDIQSWRTEPDEYSSSLGWFGMALANDQLNQLTENK